jgi:hypothetical protein
MTVMIVTPISGRQGDVRVVTVGVVLMRHKTIAPYNGYPCPPGEPQRSLSCWELLCIAVHSRLLPVPGSRYRAVSRASRWQPFVLIDTSPALTSTQELRSESLLKNKSLGRSATMSTRSRDRRSQKNAQKIELYSLAYRTAWRRISPGQKRGQPDLPLWLHTFIRHEIKEGATEASVIASEALKALGESEPGTPQSQES